MSNLLAPAIESARSALEWMKSQHGYARETALAGVNTTLAVDVTGRAFEVAETFELMVERIRVLELVERDAARMGSTIGRVWNVLKRQRESVAMAHGFCFNPDEYTVVSADAIKAALMAGAPVEVPRG